jgi:MFS family permease
MLRFIKVFVATLFISINFGALLYLNSTFLGTFFSPTTVSILFLLGAAVNVGLFLLAPKLINLFGKKWLLLISLVGLAAADLGMVFCPTTVGVAGSFITYSALLFIVYYCIDIFIEEESDDGHTGEIRGTYYTIMNAGIALGPLLLSLLPQEDGYERIYWLAFLLLIIPILIALWILVTRKHAHRKIVRPWHLLPFRRWWRVRNIRATTLAKLVLEIFFAVAVIYLPLYAHEEVGFNWSELGILFAIALTPFVLIEWPAGHLADKYWGEKEMMTVGFFLTGTALLAIPFLPHNFALWALVLFTSRIGAALVEIMTETYFFKKISASDTGLLSIFRLARPIGIILGAIIGALALGFFSFPILFFTLAVIVFFGMKESLYLKDTL